MLQDGTVGFSGDDDAIGARVGGYHGVSLGYVISDTMNVTVAYQASRAMYPMHVVAETRAMPVKVLIME